MLTWSGRFLLLVLCCGASASAQKPLNVPPVPITAPSAQAGPVTLRVVVTDKPGKPIRGLKQEDFTLLDNRQPTAIRSFEAHESEAGHQDAEAVKLVIDDVNTNFSEVSIVRTQIEKFLRGNGGHLPYETAVYLLTDSGINQVTPVSSDGNALADVLHKSEGQLHEIPRSAGFYGAEERLEISLRSLSGLATHLAQAQGRKLLVWLSPGWPIFDNPSVMISPQQQRNFFSAIVGLSGTLQQGNITLYSIDPLGTTDAATSRTFLWESFTRPVTKPSKANPGNLALQVFAVHSGGFVRSGSNDIAGEIARCAEDTTAWYTLSFDPQRADSPDTWHDIQVKVNQPGVVVRTSNGYYAQPER